ncbi:MAG: hypothetical protein ACREXS_20875 [Gammaproteobacteria bacterium]
MKLSENTNYRRYMEYCSAEQYDGAMAALQACIDDAMLSRDQGHLGYLLQLMGDVQFKVGRTADAMDYYRLAEEQSGGSLAALYKHAVFLAETLKDHQGAIEKCDQLIKASQTLLAKDASDKDGGYFLVSGIALKGHCLALQSDVTGAGECLKSLLAADESIAGHAVKLCEELMSRGYWVDDAKRYLRRVAQKLGREPKYWRLLAQIEEILRIQQA